MRAARVHALDGPSAVTVAELGVPNPGPGEVAIDVHVAGVSFPDLLMTRGRYQHRPDLPFTPGCEVAGVIRSVGLGVAWREGQRVAAYCGGGGLADVALVPETAVFELPDGVPCGIGAALSMNAFTVHFALLRRGRLRAGENVLVRGAAGALGGVSVQLAAAMGARVVAVASTEEKRQSALRSGAVEAIGVEHFAAAARELTGGAAMDVVVDPVGGEHFADSLRTLAPEGRLLVLGFAAGSIPVVKVNRLLLRNLSVVGVGWGAFASARSQYVREQWAELAPLVINRRVWPRLGASYALEDAADAVLAIEQRRSIGQSVVTVQSCSCGEAFNDTESSSPAGIVSATSSQEDI